MHRKFVDNFQKDSLTAGKPGVPSHPKVAEMGRSRRRNPTTPRRDPRWTFGDESIMPQLRNPRRGDILRVWGNLLVHHEAIELYRQADLL